MRATDHLTHSVPFLDLGSIHDELRSELIEEWSLLIESGAFTNGPEVAQFEQAFADYCGARHCIGLASGLDALRLGLLAAGIEEGDEAIVPANTFVATFEAVTQAGGKPVIVDVTESDYNLDPEAAREVVTSRTRFLLPVHLYGQMADMQALVEVAAKPGLSIIEDACQAHGATRDDLRAGVAGLAGAFSFYPGKNLGAMGDAGALVTDDEELANRVRGLREHGQTSKYEHAVEGYTARLDTIQAIVLLHKLPLLDEWNAQRQAAASFYLEALEGIGDLRLPQVAAESSHVWHLFVIRTGDPESLTNFLAERRIATGRHYPKPPHLTAAYAWLGYREGEFPVAEAVSRECLSLPIFPGITQTQLETVVEAVADYFA